MKDSVIGLRVWFYIHQDFEKSFDQKMVEFTKEVEGEFNKVKINALIKNHFKSFAGEGEIEIEEVGFFNDYDITKNKIKWADSQKGKRIKFSNKEKTINVKESVVGLRIWFNRHQNFVENTKEEKIDLTQEVEGDFDQVKLSNIIQNHFKAFDGKGEIQIKDIGFMSECNISKQKIKWLESLKDKRIKFDN